MITDLTIASHIVERLEAFEQDNERSIRVVNGLCGKRERAHYAMTDDNELLIVIWSSRSHDRIRATDTLPGAMFTDGDRRENRSQPTWDAMAIPDEYTITAPINVGRTTIGEIEPNGVYLFFAPDTLNPDVNMHASSIDVEVTFIDPLLRCMSDELATEIANAKNAALIEHFRGFFTQLENSGMDNIRVNITSAEESITEYQDALADHYSTLNRLRLQAEALQASLAQPIDERMAELGRLQDHPRLANLEADGRHMIITTTPDLILRWPEHHVERWLGAFRIKLRMADRPRFTMTNLNTQRAGRDHPHIPGGRPCLGDHQPLFMSLYTNGEFVALYDLILQYLETFNPQDDYGRYGSLWFEAPDENPALTTTEEVVANG